MKVEELSFSSVMYRVSLDSIYKVPVTSIKRTKDGKEYIINETHYEQYRCKEGETAAKTSSGSQMLYFDLEEARLAQAIMREQEIQDLHDIAEGALDKYNKTVLKYLHAPISEPE